MCTCSVLTALQPAAAAVAQTTAPVAALGIGTAVPADVSTAALPFEIVRSYGSSSGGGNGGTSAAAAAAAGTSRSHRSRGKPFLGFVMKVSCQHTRDSCLWDSDCRSLCSVCVCTVRMLVCCVQGEVGGVHKRTQPNPDPTQSLKPPSVSSAAGAQVTCEASGCSMPTKQTEFAGIY
jgi:hypothetical protein